MSEHCPICGAPAGDFLSHACHVSTCRPGWDPLRYARLRGEVLEVLRLMEEFLTCTAGPVPRGRAAKVGEWVTRLRQAVEDDA